MFIKITSHNNIKYALNVNHIVSVVESTENSCYVIVDGTKIVCNESYDDVCNKIKEVTS